MVDGPSKERMITPPSPFTPFLALRILFAQVQKIAAEVSGKLPPRLTFPRIVSTLNSFSESVELGNDAIIGEKSCEARGDDALVSSGTLAAVRKTLRDGFSVLVILPLILNFFLVVPCFRDTCFGSSFHGSGCLLSQKKVYLSG